MEHDQLKKIAQKIAATTKPLIVMPKNPNPDVLGASIGLYLALAKMDKKPQLACSSGISKKYGFLADSCEVRREIETNSEHCITFDLKSEQISAIAAENGERSVKIKITAPAGSIYLDSMKLTKKDCQIDLLIAMAAPELKRIGKIYTDNRHIFDNLEIVTINNSKKSESYGSLNLSDETLTMSELVFEIIKEMGLPAVSSEISTAFLAGIISGTKNFQADKIGYRTFEIASELIANGADRAEVIKYLRKSNIPFYVIDCYSQVAGLVMKSENIWQAISKIEEYARKKRLSAGEKAILLIMAAVFVSQGIKGVQNVQSEEAEKTSLFKLPERNIVYALEKLPVSNEYEYTEELAPVPVKDVESAGNYVETPISGEAVQQDGEISDPSTLKIASLGVNANIQYVGLNDDGSVGVPSNEKEVAWYMFGAKPGNEGNAVIIGHRDSKNNPNGVFRRLNSLRIGDVVAVIDKNGRELKFKVVKKATYDDANAPMQEIFGSTEKKMLNLITCIGSWNEKENNYDKRIVIYSEFVA